MDLSDALKLSRFDHEWLSDAFVEQSRTLAVRETARRHHYVPEFYLRRWCVDGKLKPFDIDTRTALHPRPPRSVAFERDLYTIPTDPSANTPMIWLETHLSRIETQCSKHIATLVSESVGIVDDHKVTRDLSVFLGLQVSRTVAARHRTMAIVSAPDSAKRKLLQQLMPSATPAEIDQSMEDQLPDRTHEAIRLLVEDVRNTLASGMFNRRWAVYESASPAVTSDEPVVMIAGPPHQRSSSVGAGLSAALLYPLSPDRVLVMLRADLGHTEPFTLDKHEMESINWEVLATANRVSFERPNDSIGEGASVPSRRPLVEPDYGHLGDDDAIALMLSEATPSSRWDGTSTPPPWPIARWYQG